MARYVDGFVIPIPKRQVAAYRRLAARVGKIWMEHGALQYVECIGEDMQEDAESHPGLRAVKMGMPFPRLARVKAGETVVFSWIVYKSRAHRDKVNAKVMADPRIANNPPDVMPFDPKHMTYGGFEAIVDL